MPAYDYDFFVIGAGSGGVRAARIAATHGARVAVAEERYLGGTCVNVGCIPKKLLVYASEFADAFADAAGFGWEVGAPTFDWSRLLGNKDREIERLNGVYERLLTAAGARIIRGRAELAGAHAVRINGATFTARYILLATGSWPTVPEIPGADLAITSNEAFHLARLPRRVVIVGGGYIAVEFAGIFHGLGAQVTLIHRGDALLRGFDDDLRIALGEEIRQRGIDLRLKSRVTAIARSDGHLRATLEDHSTVTTELVMFATGRHPNSRGFGVEEAGVALDRDGAVVVGEDSRSSVESIFAIGDLTNRRCLTPVAIAEGHALADTLFGNRPRTLDYDNIPSAVFSQPPLASVGLSEAEARRRYGRVDIYKSAFTPLKHTLSGRRERTLMKLVVDGDSGRVVGAHMIGADAGEIIQGLAIALKCGATKAQFDATIGIHPTAAEEFVTMRQKS
ncbi:MAG TPA: glutathione-disulfide reductase [Candidatus Binataceae bacterium]|nr:glutathione-disulfide reductase [Candidatus Binataceae bacterium]